ncbi:MAG: c-type cytochrome domain-containing protein, partial [Bacteroidota bacterium]
MSNAAHIRFIPIAGVLLILLFVLLAADSPNASISFNEDVRPILNQHCLRCHGGVKQSGGFSLLFEEDAFQPTDSDKPAIVRGKPEASELYLRLQHPDPELRMPYESPALSQEEVDILYQWIDEGARWETHWAYQVPRQAVLPMQDQEPIDAFVQQTLKAAGLT